MNEQWRTSSYSGPNGGQCVEVAPGPVRVLVRDTKDRPRGVLAVSGVAWTDFLAFAGR